MRPFPRGAVCIIEAAVVPMEVMKKPQHSMVIWSNRNVIKEIGTLLTPHSFELFRGETWVGWDCCGPPRTGAVESWQEMHSNHRHHQYCQRCCSGSPLRYYVLARCLPVNDVRNNVNKRWTNSHSWLHTCNRCVGVISNIIQRQTVLHAITNMLWYVCQLLHW